MPFKTAHKMNILQPNAQKSRRMAIFIGSHARKAMPTNITETVQAETGNIMLRVEGDLLLEDALLLERIARSIVDERFENVVIDLADLDFLDSESAAVLKRLVACDGIELNGIEIFLQSAIDLAERGA